MSAKGQSWRTGAKPPSDCLMTDQDHDMITETLLPEALEHAGRLCGRLLYSMPQVKPVESAAVIYRLVGILRRVIASRSYVRMRSLEKTVREQRFELILLRAAKPAE